MYGVHFPSTNPSHFAADSIETIQAIQYWSYTAISTISNTFFQAPHRFFHPFHIRCKNTRASNWIRLKHFSFNSTIILLSQCRRNRHENGRITYNTPTQAKHIKCNVALWKIIKGLQAHLSIHIVNHPSTISSFFFLARAEGNGFQSSQ